MPGSTVASAAAYALGSSAVLKPRSANDEHGLLRESLRSLVTAPNHGGAMSFKTWDEVPSVPTAAHKKQKWFVEVFAGKAWLTRAMRKAGWSTLPPVEINVEGDTLASADLLDPVLRAKINAWISSGCVQLVHFGTPCATFSRARKAGDGGPPPLRTDDQLQGVPGLDPDDAEKVRLGTLFLDITLELCRAIALAGGHWPIKNPESSMLWLMPQVQAFLGISALQAPAPHVRLRVKAQQANCVRDLRAALGSHCSFVPRGHSDSRA